MLACVHICGQIYLCLCRVCLSLYLREICVCLSLSQRDMCVSLSHLREIFARKCARGQISLSDARKYARGVHICVQKSRACIFAGKYLSEIESVSDTDTEISSLYQTQIQRLV